MLDNICDSLKTFGVTADEAANAFCHFARNIPQFTEADISAIKNNPSLSFISKYKIIKNMRKQMKEGLVI